jgi:hypothetical protein
MKTDHTFVGHVFHNVYEASKSEEIPDDFLEHQVTMGATFAIDYRHLDDSLLRPNSS